MRIVALVVAAVVVLVVAFLMIFLRRQTISYATRWVGPPQESTDWAPLPGEPDLHLVAVGDMGDSGRRSDSVAAAVSRVDEAQPIDDLLLLGDNVYPDGDPDRIPETVFDPYAAVLEHADLLAIIGNHDVMGGRADEQLEVLGQSGNRWAVEQADTLVVGLDSNELLRDGEEQLDWLDRTLADSGATWRIVAVHHPPYSAGYQGSSLRVREQLAPILERHGVQLVLSGHDHDYQRSTTMDGVNYVVSGAGSGTRRTGRSDFTAESFAWLHFTDIGVYEDRMVVRSVSEDLEMADQVEIAPDGSVTELGP